MTGASSGTRKRLTLILHNQSSVAILKFVNTRRVTLQVQYTLIIILMMMMMVVVMMLSWRRRGVVLHCHSRKIDDLVGLFVTTGTLRGLTTSRRQLAVTWERTTARCRQRCPLIRWLDGYDEIGGIRYHHICHLPRARISIKKKIKRRKKVNLFVLYR